MLDDYSGCGLFGSVAIQASIVLMSQNRAVQQAERSRRAGYRVNRRAEAENRVTARLESARPGFVARVER